MFLQIFRDKESRKFHRIVWQNGKGPLKLFQFRVHAFGNKGSGAVANYNVQQVALDHRTTHPEASETICESTLMDDSMDSYPDVRTAQKVVQDLKQLFGLAGMHPHKFLSNHKEVLVTIPPEDRANKLAVGQAKDLTTADAKILGIQYSSELDEFHFKTPDISTCRATWTKRRILSTFPRVFDPIGFLQPYQLIAKKTFQEITMLKLDWDEPEPEGTLNQWRPWVNDLIHLNRVMVPRCTMARKEGAVIKDERIHIFMDASESGYCAVAYRTTFYDESEEETGHSAFLVAKAKVTPLKVLCIPRLELLAAELALKVYLEIKKAHPLKEDKFHFHTDSIDVLCWITTETKQLQRFIAHRTAKIQDLTPVGNWHYIRSADNPADIGSRGCDLRKLIDSDLWWEGPHKIVRTKKPLYEAPPSRQMSSSARKEIKKINGLEVSAEGKTIAPNAGRRKDKVFPVPVRARPTTSFPDKMMSYVFS